MRRPALLALTLSVVMCSLAASASAATIPGRYIVVLKDSAGDPAAVGTDHAKRYGVQRDHTYRHALRGYAAAVPASKLSALRSDSRVSSVVPDEEVRLPPNRPVGRAESGSQATGATTCPLNTLSGFPTQCVPPGIDRIDGDLSSTRAGNRRGTVNINVAVVDDGLDRDHPDLSVAGGFNCGGGKAADWEAAPGGKGDHGTFVGGIIGARDNAFGVVGVAPGARLWGVRVFNKTGLGSTARLVCGIDWTVASRRDADRANDIAVLNMSLGGTGVDDGQCGQARNRPSSPLHLAVCTAVAEGITPIASAGNESDDLQFHAPAAFNEVLAVSAMADFDGRPGGLEPTFCRGFDWEDDAAAFFSNFATLSSDASHTVSAPGVCVVSTIPVGGLLPESDTNYALWDGTSFSAPHVSGLVALCIASGRCAGRNAEQIVQKIVADAHAYNQANSPYGYDGDPLRPTAGKYYGYLIRAGLY